MTEGLHHLDERRGPAAQIATEIRRNLAEVELCEKVLRDKQQELEAQLVAAPATNWPEAAEKARYLLKLFAATPMAQDARRKKLIASVLEDFARLSEVDEAVRYPESGNSVPLPK